MKDGHMLKQLKAHVNNKSCQSAVWDRLSLGTRSCRGSPGWQGRARQPILSHCPLPQPGSRAAMGQAQAQGSIISLGTPVEQGWPVMSAHVESCRPEITWNCSCLNYNCLESYQFNYKKNYKQAIYWVPLKISWGRLKVGGTSRRGRNYFLQIFLSASEASAVMV